MSENERRGERAKRKFGRWAGGLSAVGAMGVVALMALAPAASAVSILKTSSPLLQESAYIQGCAKAAAAMPKISLLTGLGSEAGLKGSAKTCSKALGGVNTISQGSASAELGASKTMKLTFAASSINISWDIKAAVMTAATGSFRVCPTTSYTGSYTIFSGNQSSFVTYNDTSSYCAATAEWELFTEMYVDDLTTGSFLFGGFSSMYNQSGNYYDKYSDTTNYSNPNATLGWTNGTFSGTSTHSYGAFNSTTITWTPTGTLSGSWASGDKIQITAYLFMDAYAILEYEHGTAAVKLAASGLAGHVDITGFNIS